MTFELAQALTPCHHPSLVHCESPTTCARPYRSVMQHDKTTPMPGEDNKGDGRGAKRTSANDTSSAERACANGCGISASKWCGRCRSVVYCSPTCQREYWSKGGHKKTCKPAQTNVSITVTTETSAAEARRSDMAAGSDGGVCIICLDCDPTPIQSGCACRGDSGLAHVKCRAEAAAHRFAHAGKSDGWYGCRTCGQDFTEQWC